MSTAVSSPGRQRLAAISIGLLLGIGLGAPFSDGWRGRCHRRGTARPAATPPTAAGTTMPAADAPVAEAKRTLEASPTPQVPGALAIPIEGAGECIRLAPGVRATLLVEEAAGACPSGRGFYYLDGLLDSGSVLDQTHFVPRFRSGAARGFKVFGIRDDSLLADLGLQSGDAVLRVDGSAIDSPDDALELFERLRTAERFEVEVERRGQMLTLVIAQPCGAPPRRVR